MVIVLVVICLLILTWIAGVVFLNDRSVKRIGVGKFKKILLVFPHADDEVLTCGGLIQAVSSAGGQVTYLVLTAGERGNEGASYDEKLKQIRYRELKKTSKILGVAKIIQKDLGDGKLKNKKSDVEKVIAKVLEKESPDLVITYDLAGLYGHNDHITASEVTTELIKERFRNTKLWYTAQNKKILSFIKLPEHMAASKEYSRKRADPTHKIFAGFGIFNKIRALYAYKSQYESSFKKSFPFKPLPPAIFISMWMYEYYYEV